ncbi:MAG: hypothetical protein IPP60_09195 [Sphingobacteriales bacterium]|nr:hypothetical protein [Sphingobacteriales bacterium]
MKNQIINISICIFFTMAFVACKKQGPATIDNIKPNLIFEVSGVRKFFSDTDYTALGRLYLNPAINYNFTESINDTGGVKRIQVSTDSLLRLSNVVSVPDHTSNNAIVTGNPIQIFEINGVESNPFTSFIMSGKMVPNSSTQQDSTIFIYCEGDDYNPNNTTHIIIPCIITNQPPNGYGWKRL